MNSLVLQKPVCNAWKKKRFFSITARKPDYGSKYIHFFLSQPEGNVDISKIKRTNSVTPVDVIESIYIP